MEYFNGPNGDQLAQVTNKLDDVKNVMGEWKEDKEGNKSQINLKSPEESFHLYSALTAPSPSLAISNKRILFVWHIHTSLSTY